jgi:hypothetical protein
MPPDRFFRPGSALLGLSLVLGGCALVPSAPSAPSPAPPAVTSAPRLPEGTQVTAVASTVAIPGAAPARANAQTATAAADPQPPQDAPEVSAVKFLLAYAERLRTLKPAELATEIAALGEPGPQPMAQMQLALALMHSHQPVDTARALGLFQRVVAQEQPGALPYKPLARLLAAQLLDQRKLEESVERQSQQLREQQRRIEQLTERLEAMRAIERSLNTRPGSPSGTRNRAAPAP